MYIDEAVAMARDILLISFAIVCMGMLAYVFGG